MTSRCAICQRPIILTRQGWQHTRRKGRAHGPYNHPAYHRVAA